ncbi:MAG: hypothetical protein PHC64_01675 [Candidatus Gastranaerophilales bacterium]|nr:hypothetical protein [Candidatus Gastranaerophilales bacterium]
MYNKKDLVKNLNELNYFIDEATLNNFIRNWKIDAIYEDEDGIEFYDNLAIIKLKKGISLKSQGYANEQIAHHIKNIAEEKQPQPKKEVKNLPAEKPALPSELQNLTIDVTGQTLQMLADAVAAKITADIKEQIQKSEFVTQLLEDGSLKKDNEILSQKVEELTQDNKKLAKRVEELELSRKRFPINFEYFRKFFN